MENCSSLELVKQLVASGHQFTIEEYETMPPEAQAYLQEIKKLNERELYRKRIQERDKRRQEIADAAFMSDFYKNAAQGKYMFDSSKPLPKYVPKAKKPKSKKPNEWELV